MTTLSTLALGAVLFVAAAAAPAVPLSASIDPVSSPALQAPRAARSVMLAVAAAGPRLVAVGERGIALWSDDGGLGWHQAAVPVSVTLTALSFPTATEGWAVGHGGVVLHTADGGQHWTRQLDGRQAAHLELQAAQAAGDPKRLSLATQLVDDGPDKPFLAVHFWNARRGVAIGAYGIVFGTEDGGATWTSWVNRVDNPKRLHLNALYVSGSTVYLAGEQGLLLRSRDDAHSFQAIESPYKGSWFAMTGQGDAVVLAGLRGNVFWSTDEGASWTASQVPVPITITSAVATPAGLFFTNQAGALLASADGRSLRTLARPPGAPLTALDGVPGGGLLAASFAGPAVLSGASLPVLHP